MLKDLIQFLQYYDKQFQLDLKHLVGTKTRLYGNAQDIRIQYYVAGGREGGPGMLHNHKALCNKLQPSVSVCHEIWKCSKLLCDFLSFCCLSSCFIMETEIFFVCLIEMVVCDCVCGCSPCGKGEHTQLFFWFRGNSLQRRQHVSVSALVSGSPLCVCVVSTGNEMTGAAVSDETREKSLISFQGSSTSETDGGTGCGLLVFPSSFHFVFSEQGFMLAG